MYPESPIDFELSFMSTVPIIIKMAKKKSENNAWQTSFFEHIPEEEGKQKIKYFFSKSGKFKDFVLHYKTKLLQAFRVFDVLFQFGMLS